MNELALLQQYTTAIGIVNLTINLTFAEKIIFHRMLKIYFFRSQDCFILNNDPLGNLS